MPLHPRDRLARAMKQGKGNVKFIKQVPLHPRERLKKNKKIKTLRDKMKDKELQIAWDNVSSLMNGKFSFNPKKY